MIPAEVGFTEVASLLQSCLMFGPSVTSGRSAFIVDAREGRAVEFRVGEGGSLEPMFPPKLLRSVALCSYATTWGELVV